MQLHEIQGKILKQHGKPWFTPATKAYAEYCIGQHNLLHIYCDINLIYTKKLNFCLDIKLQFTIIRDLYKLIMTFLKENQFTGTLKINTLPPTSRAKMQGIHNIIHSLNHLLFTELMMTCCASSLHWI